MKDLILGKNGGWVIAALAGAGVVLFLLYSFLPRRAEIAEMRRQAEEKQRFVAQAAGTNESLTETVEELSGVQEFVTAWRQGAADEENLNWVFREINHLAQTSQTRNLRLEPAAVQRMSAVWRLPVRLTAEGEFSQLFRFVRGLESLAPGVWLSDLKMGEMQNESQTLRMDVTLTIFGVKRDFSGQADLAH